MLFNIESWENREAPARSIETERSLDMIVTIEIQDSHAADVVMLKMRSAHYAAF